MKCPRCGNVNRSQARFCHECSHVFPRPFTGVGPRVLFVVLAGLFLAGVGTLAVSVVRNVLADRSQRTAIRSRLTQLQPGMTREQVAAILGEPDFRQVIQAGNETIQQWHYGHARVRFVDGKLKTVLRD